MPGRERGERSLMCASVPRETDRLVSRLVSNPSFCERDRPQAAEFNAELRDCRDDVPGDWIVRAPDRDIVAPRAVPQVRCRASATGNRTVHQMPDRVRRCSQAASTQMHPGLVLGADEPESFGWMLASGPSLTTP